MTGLINPEIDTLLKDTSRSFFITLQALPSKIRSQVGLLYLLARIADTIADSKEGETNQLLATLIEYTEVAIGDENAGPLPDFSELAQLQDNEAEAILLQNVPAVIACLENCSEGDKGRIRQCLEIITSGQAKDLRRFGIANEEGVISSLENDEELDEYAYRVAGSVGEFWTRMSLAHLFKLNAEKEAELFDLGVRFGKALQLINILRDIPEDLRFGRCYIPADRMAEYDLKSDDLLDPNNMEKFRPLYNQYIEVAASHLDAAVEYISMLPYSQFRLRGSCMLPVLIGQRTLTLLRTGNVLDAENRVKVSRDEIKILIKKTKRSLIIPGGSKKLLKSNRGP